MNMAYDRRQLRALCFTASLAPVTRLLPKMTAQIAGSASWIAPLCALPMLLLFCAVLSEFMKQRREGEGLAEASVRLCGRGAGGAVLLIMAVFMLFNAGFILRSGAHRLISTIYPASGPWVFIISMLILGTAAAMGPVKALPRAGRVFAPILAAVMLLTLAFSVSSVEIRNILPVTTASVGQLFISGLAVVEIYGGVLFSAAILEDRTPLEGHRFSFCAAWLSAAALLLTVLCAVIIGCYGAKLTASFAHPFFSMIRDVTLLKTVERIEALVAALWVLSDFTLFTLLLIAASHAIRVVFGFRTESKPEKLLSMRAGRFIIPICSVLCLTAAIAVPTESMPMKLISQGIIPAMNLCVCFVLIPLLLVIARIKEHKKR